jgi:AmmeMemoRadiSam system protein B/AmmeMemoRadiSam system protein A
MKTLLSQLVLLSAIFIQLSSCNAQPNEQQTAKIDRPPAVAGSFYPADKTSLTKQLETFFNNASSTSAQNPLAIIVPHAGYVYSGGVAAVGFKQINRNTQFKHVFVIGSSHTPYFKGASVYTDGDFLTPMGRVTVDTLATWLDKKYNFINNNTEPHVREHSLEVQLPFLQYWLTKPFCIVPIIVGGESPEDCKQLAKALAPFLIPDNLFIISTDFSHYPNAQNANYSDSIIANAILSNSPTSFLKAKADNESKNIPNLQTAICGWTSVLTMLDITTNLPDITYEKIIHKTSGDASIGDRNRVVGYYAIGVFQKQQTANYELSESDKKTLLSLARKTIIDHLQNKKITQNLPQNISTTLRIPAGAFVTLKENGELRGCIGNFSASQPLYNTVQTMAISSATEDPRFNPVTVSEMSNLKIEISVLTPMRKIASIDEIELGKHGIYIKKGNRAGTFLPQVATETRWTKEEFLGHCARDKAYIGWDGWKDAEIYIYEALVFGE